MLDGLTTNQNRVRLLRTGLRYQIYSVRLKCNHHMPCIWSFFVIVIEGGAVRDATTCSSSNCYCLVDVRVSWQFPMYTHIHTWLLLLNKCTQIVFIRRINLTYFYQLFPLQWHPTNPINILYCFLIRSTRKTVVRLDDDNYKARNVLDSNNNKYIMFFVTVTPLPNT